MVHPLLSLAMAIMPALVLRVPLQPFTGIDRRRKAWQGTALACRQRVGSGAGLWSTKEVSRANLPEPGV